MSRSFARLTFAHLKSYMKDLGSYSKDGLPKGVVVGSFTYGHTGSTFVVFGDQDRIVIGKFCSIGPGAKILGGGEHRTDLASTYPLKTRLTRADGRNYDATSKGHTQIGSDVWIGMDAVIMSGVTVGDGAIIGARSLVASDVPPYAIVAGNPGRTIKFRFSPEQIEKLLRISWWNWNVETIIANEDDFYGDVESFIAKHMPL